MDLYIRLGIAALIAAAVILVVWRMTSKRPRTVIPAKAPEPYVSPEALTWLTSVLSTAMAESGVAGESRRVQIVLDPTQPLIRAIPFAAEKSFHFDLWKFHPEPSGKDLLPGLPMSERQSVINILLKRFDGFRLAAVAAILRDGSNEDRHMSEGFTPPGWFIPATFFYRDHEGHDVLKAVNIGIEYEQDEKNEEKPTTALQPPGDDCSEIGNAAEATIKAELLETDPERWLAALVELATRRRFHSAEIRTKDRESSIGGITNCCDDDSHGERVTDLDRQAEQALVELLLRKTGRPLTWTYRVWGSFEQVVDGATIKVEVYDHRDLSKCDPRLRWKPHIGLLVTKLEQSPASDEAPEIRPYLLSS